MAPWAVSKYRGTSVHVEVLPLATTFLLLFLELTYTKM